jgi:hypothetical protein
MSPASASCGQPDPNQHNTGPGAQKLMAPNPVLQKILFTRLETLDADQVKAFVGALNPDNIPVFQKVLPELSPIYQKVAQLASQQQGGGQECSQGAPQGGASGGPGATQMAPICPNGSANGPGFASGGLAGLFGYASGGLGNERNGYVNKGIPNTGLARGGFPAIAAAPHPMALERPMSPASSKFSSRVANNPKFAQGGVIMKYACGGPGLGAPPQGGAQQPQTGPTGNPDSDQAIANQKTAEQIVPKEGTADNINAKVSKGEYVMDAATVMFYGMDKLSGMQEKAHQGIADHLAKQQAQQNDQSSTPPSQVQQAQAQQQAQQPQQKQGMGSPLPTSMPPAAATPPNGTEQRIAQTNTPRPQQNPMSLMG